MKKSKEINIISKKYGKISFIIDEEDYYKIKDYKHRVSIDKGKSYIKSRYLGREPSVQLHHLITGYTFVDHKNGNTLDNRKSNLRDSNYQLNNFNAKKRKDGIYSKYKGVKLYNKDKWISRIQFKKKRITIGIFDTEIEAAIAYDVKAKFLFGEYAYLNFKDNKNVT